MNNFFQNLNRLIKWKDKLKRAPWFLGRRAFFIILVLILFSIVLGALLFYNYVVIIEAEDLKVSENSLKLREDLYNKILERWQPKGQIESKKL